MQPRLRQLLTIPLCSGNCFISLMSPAWTLSMTLSWSETILMIWSNLTHVWGMAMEDAGNHLGDECRQFGQAVVSKQSGDCPLVLLKVWSLCSMASNMALTAVFMHKYGPFYTGLVFLIPTITLSYMQKDDVVGDRTKPFVWWVFASLTEP